MSLPPDDFGGRIRWARQLADISARSLDELAGRSPGHLAAIETRVGARTEVETIGPYLRALGLRWEWVLYGEGPAPTERSVRAAFDAAVAAQGSATGTEG